MHRLSNYAMGEIAVPKMPKPRLKDLRPVVRLEGLRSGSRA